MSDVTLPRFITYIPLRGTGDWRTHMTIGNLRNALRQNGYGREAPSWWNERQIENNQKWQERWRIFEIAASGTWSEVAIEDVFRKGIW